jgi:hypothetical protein
MVGVGTMQRDGDVAVTPRARDGQRFLVDVRRADLGGGERGVPGPVSGPARDFEDAPALEELREEPPQLVKVKLPFGELLDLLVLGGPAGVVAHHLRGHRAPPGRPPER